MHLNKFRSFDSVECININREQEYAKSIVTCQLKSIVAFESEKHTYDLTEQSVNGFLLFIGIDAGELSNAV